MTKSKSAGARQKPRHNLSPVRAGSRPAAVAQSNDTAPATPDTDLENRWRLWQKTHVNGTLPEYVAWNWLTNNQHMREHSDFIYRWSLGHKDTIDFYFPNLKLGWLIDDRVVDRSTRGAMLAQMMAKGIVGVELKGADVQNRTASVLTAALDGTI